MLQGVAGGVVAWHVAAALIDGKRYAVVCIAAGDAFLEVSFFPHKVILFSKRTYLNGRPGDRCVDGSARILKPATPR